MRTFNNALILCMFAVLAVACGSSGGTTADPGAGDGVIANDVPGETTCVARCENRQCGSDGCGGTCGTCPTGQECDADGHCTHAPKACCAAGDGPGCADATIEKCVCAKYAQCCTLLWDVACVDAVEDLGCGTCCSPKCDGKSCGADGCGGTCGPCGDGQTCIDGACKACSCEGRACGDDGCGTSCGTCADGDLCDPKGQCVAQTACGVCHEGLECGKDAGSATWCVGDACGSYDDTGTCSAGIVVFCDSGKLWSIDCEFLSGGKSTCGFDPESGYNDCVCKPRCDGKSCGDDGCGGQCGTCESGKTCEAGACVACSCDGKACGDDGCGTSCGECTDGQACDWIGACVTATECGVCYEGLTCVPPTEEDGGYCTADACGSFDATGQCFGDVVVFCDQATLFSIDCATIDGLMCGYDAGYGWNGCVCKPDCGGKTCGDDGCGGSCGTCGSGQYCSNGTCTACGCSGKECGDDGCGNSCGACSDGEFCTWQNLCVPAVISECCAPDPKAGCALDAAVEACVCQTDPYCCDTEWDIQCVDWIDELKCGVCCIPQCGGKVCGPDGCGGYCGMCTGGTFCGPEGTCATCSCGAKTCGTDECGQSCGSCGEGQHCEGGTCKACGCDGKQCGDDGCGGTCGTCDAGLACVAGACVDPVFSKCCDESDTPGCRDEPAVEACVCAEDPLCCTSTWDFFCAVEVELFECGLCCMPDCKDKQCGNDGCGGTCGQCADGQGCSTDGQCTACTCASGQECGPDSCGKPVCGSCGGGEVCGADNTCVPCGCGGRECGAGPCGEECGTCAAGQYCEAGACKAFSGSCCEAHNTAGCSDTTIAACVCAQESYCCTKAWDLGCVTKVGLFSCGTCN